MTVRRLSPSPILLLAATFAGGGCNGLTVDRESMVFSFPREQPEMRVLLVYEGLRVRGDKPADLEEAKKQLTELFVRRQEFWLAESQVPLRFSLRDPGPGGDSPFFALLRKHVRIDRVELFRPADGRFCAYQALTVRDPEWLAVGLNALITVQMARNAREELAKPATEPEGDTDRATWRLIQKACRGQYQWLRVQPGRFSLTVPASPEFSRRAKAWVLGLKNLEELEAAVRGGKPTLTETTDPFRTFLHTRARLGDLSDMPWSFDQRAERFTLSLGYGGGEPIRATPRSLPALPPNPLDQDLRAFARRLEIPLREKTEVGAVIEEFLNPPRGD